MISRSISPVSLLTSAQVRRDTTADLIFVRSPSSKLRKLLVQRLADDQIEHGVAEELHPLVAMQPRVGDRGVGQRLFEQSAVVKRILEDLLGPLL